MLTIGITYGLKESPKGPIRDEKYLHSYEALFGIAREMGLRLILVDNKKCIKGVAKKGFVYNGYWKTVENVPLDIIHYKSGPDISRMAGRVPVFNDPKFTEICDDKAAQYRLFHKLMPRSFMVNSKKGFLKIKKKIRTKKIVFKPRYGTQGEGITISSNPPKRIPRNTLIQEFVEYGKSPVKGERGAWDMRIVVINGKIDNAYLRINRKSRFISNIAKGGKKFFINNKDVSRRVRNCISFIDRKFSRFKNRIYSADFILDKDGKPWLIETNSPPGMYYPDKKRQHSFYTHLLLLIKKAYNDSKN